MSFKDLFAIAVQDLLSKLEKGKRTWVGSGLKQAIWLQG